ncbi:hypothetical protein L2E82_17466 [Cichorium intybus]|uniref:Uncharacterized protein n=1 Tax=Cichorium intybus TaxID=13427 RepID=A0ACB9F8C5_CICIN|nr:hypothetical protein L2E82_17466 [Cichorium intybus]
MTLIEGTLTEHYAKLWSYGVEIRRTNPGSTVKLDVNSMPNGKNYFIKFYVCRDANTQIFPIAWAVVCVENKENWQWFLDLLKDDIDLALGNGLTLMSDQHNGLMEAVKELLPQAEHRQCARHICYKGIGIALSTCQPVLDGQGPKDLVKSIFSN